MIVKELTIELSKEDLFDMLRGEGSAAKDFMYANEISFETHLLGMSHHVNETAVQFWLTFTPKEGS